MTAHDGKRFQEAKGACTSLAGKAAQDRRPDVGGQHVEFGRRLCRRLAADLGNEGGDVRLNVDGTLTGGAGGLAQVGRMRLGNGPPSAVLAGR
jgi:hypothetical protein